MADKDVQDYVAAMAVLAAEFAQRLQHDLQELRDSAENSDEHVLPDMLARVHKLAGSALTFGYQRLGEQLRSLEQDMLAGGLPWPGIRQRLLTLQVSDHPVPAQVPDNLVVASQVAPELAEEAKHALIYFLVADNQDFSNLLVQLQGYNYDVLQYRAIEELYKDCVIHQPDAVILSVAMSDEQGRVMQQQIQELRSHGSATLPILICSPHQDLAIKLVALRAGVQGFFDRAISVTSLDTRLGNLLDKQELDPWRVLLVDDDESILKYFCQVLQTAGLNVRVESDPVQVLSVMQQFQPDVLVFDLNMPACRGDELAAIIRLDDMWLHVPIIYLSSETDLGRQLAAQTLAGDEFLSKPVDLAVLVAIVKVRAHRSRQLLHMLTRDGLTGLLTHAEIKDRLSQELVRVSRNGSQCCVAMLDIDWFKKVNDNYGHLVGDSVIRHLSGLLKGHLRRTDLVGRYGGEEFLLLLPDCDLKHAFNVVDKLRKIFASLPMSTAVQGFYCTFSAGISCSHPGRDERTDDLIARADEALYLAKVAGRNQVMLE